MPNPTATQLLYLSFIRAYTEGFGIPPSMHEIAEALEVSDPSVNSMLKSLEKKGLIERQSGTARSIEILVDCKLIPAWRKKLVTSFRIWAPGNASQELLDQRTEAIIQQQKAHRLGKKRKKQLTARMAPGETPTVYCLKISLLSFKPTIWRRVETLDVTLAELHQLIQVAMGWHDCHMHLFTIADQEYIDGSIEENDYGGIDYQGIWLGDLVKEYGSKIKLKYEYDFGDDWEHSIALEKMRPMSGSWDDFPRCLAGALACPPEDVGGVYGFSEYLEAIQDPSHPEHEQMLDWSGPYDLNDFDKDKVTRALQDPMVYNS